MKLENGHHLRSEDLTKESYHELCQKIKSQGFGSGEYPYAASWMNHPYVGIFHGKIYHGSGLSFDNPEKLLTIDQALSGREENTMSKARIIEIKEEHKFKPFKLEIDIDSEEDLINIWHRMHLNDLAIEGFYPTGTSKLTTSKTDWKQSRIDIDVWNVLEVKAKELGLRE